MKKLMTMLSAATVAIGLYADTYTDTGTSFENADIGGFSLTTEDDIGSATGYWGTEGDTNAFTVATGGSIARNADPIEDEPPYPKQFVETDQDKHLHIASSFGNPLTRYVNTDHNGMTLEGDFYFDSLVKFTAFDAGDLPLQVTNELASAKIAVWIQTSDDESATNLWVRAGQFDGNGVIHPHDYNCGEFFNADAWHRLTIKAIKNISTDEGFKPGFAVFIDNQILNSIGEDSIGLNNIAGECFGFYKAGNLFPSMVQAVQDAGEITSVSFDGQGDIDDVVFTANQPFKAAAAAQMATITWNPETTHIARITIDGTVYTNGSVQIEYESPVTIGITYADGWTGPAEIRVDIDSSTKTAALSADIAGEIVAYFTTTDDQTTAFTNLNVAVQTINKNGLQGTLKLRKTTDDPDIAFEIAESITIDLNGQTIGGIDASDTPVAIIDTSDNDGVVSGFVTLGEGSSIAAGVFEDEVALVEGSSITGGKFSATKNDAEVLNGFVALENYELTEVEGYLVLTEQKPPVEVTINGGANATATWTVNDMQLEEAPDQMRGNDRYEVALTANTGYEFAGVGTTTNIVGVAETNDFTITLPNATAASYTITYMYGENELTELAPATYTIADDVVLPTNVTLSVFGVSFEAWTNAEGTVVAGWSDGDKTGNQTFYAKVTAVVPPAGEEIKPGEESATDYETAEAAEAAAAKVTVTASEAVTTALKGDTAAYVANFEAVAVPNGEGGYKVAVVLTDAAEAALTTAAEAAAAGMVADLTEDTVEITAKPGFYYSIEYGTSLESMIEGERTMATSATLELDRPTTENATSGFYRVLVNVSDK